MEHSGKLREVAALFLKLGILSFGGPAAHIAMMEDEVVKKRKWMPHEHFLDLVGATNLIPGPNSTEMTMHCGHERAGYRGRLPVGRTIHFQKNKQRICCSWRRSCWLLAYRVRVDR